MRGMKLNDGQKTKEAEVYQPVGLTMQSIQQALHPLDGWVLAVGESCFGQWWVFSKVALNALM